MNNTFEAAIIAANYMSAMIALMLMQTIYRNYTLPERLALAFFIGSLAVNASMHVLDGRNYGACAEALLSVAILTRLITASIYRILKHGSLTILCGASLLMLAGCQVSYPLGESGKYGTIKASVTYVAPVNLWLNPAPFLADK